jgi:hypothetical protein
MHKPAKNLNNEDKNQSDSSASFIAYRFSCRPLRGLSVLAANGKLCISVSSLNLSAECIFVVLACALNEWNEHEKAEKSDPFSLSSVDWVHLLESKRLRETFIPHVEAADEREISKAFTVLGIVRSDVGVRILLLDYSQMLMSS